MYYTMEIPENVYHNTQGALRRRIDGWFRERTEEKQRMAVDKLLCEGVATHVIAHRLGVQRSYVEWRRDARAARRKAGDTSIG